MLYTDKELLKWLREYAEQIGKTPTKQMLHNDKTMPSDITYVNRFGKYSIACKKAGLAVNTAGRKKKGAR